MITGGSFTFSQKLVPAQYEAKEASMTINFEAGGDAPTAAMLARDMVLDMLGLPVERRAVRHDEPTAMALPLLAGAVPFGAPIPQAQVAVALPPTQLSAGGPPTATPLPLEAATSTLPQTLPTTIPSGNTTLPVEVGNLSPAPENVEPEWTQKYVLDHILYPALDRLKKVFGGDEQRANAALMECVGKFSGNPPSARRIPVEQREAFLAELGALK